MSAQRNLIGQQFGRGIVIAEAGRTPNQNMIWKLRCDWAWNTRAAPLIFSTAAYRPVAVFARNSSSTMPSQPLTASPGIRRDAIQPIGHGGE
jgi:hypothetical protein